MASCHKLTLEGRRGSGPLPRCGGHGREQPAEGVAAEPFDRWEGTRHAPRRGGLSSAAMGPLGARLYACWRRFRHGCQTCTRATRGRASDSLRGQWTRDGARHCANLARTRTGADGPAVHHCRSKAPWSGPGGGPQRQAESTATPALAHGRPRRVAARAEETAGTPHGGAARQSHGRMGQGEGGRVDPCRPSAQAPVGLGALVEGALVWPPEGWGPDVAQRRQAWGRPAARTGETQSAVGLTRVHRATGQRRPCARLAGDALSGRDRPWRAAVATDGGWEAAPGPAATPGYVRAPPVGVPQQRRTRGRPRTRRQGRSAQPPQAVRLFAGRPDPPGHPRHGRQTARGRWAADWASRHVGTVVEGTRTRAAGLVRRRDAAGDGPSTRRHAPAAPPAPPRMAWSGQRACPARPVAEAKTARGGDAGHAQTSRAWEPHGARTGWAVWCVAQTTWAWAQA